MHDVFISHSSSDKDRVAPLVEALQREGIDLWWDQELVVGATFRPEIEAELRSARCVIVCWSKSVLERAHRWVQGEAERALQRGVALSVLLDEMDIPTGFNVDQAVSLSNWSGDPGDLWFRRLVEGIRAKIRASSPPHESPGLTRNRRALLVGVANNEYGLPRLGAAKGNAEDLHRVLKQPACDFDVKLLVDPEYAYLMEEVEVFFKGGSTDDLLLFYFAGHVQVTDNNTFHMMATNSRLDRNATMPLLAQLASFINGSAAGNILAVFDPCYGKGKFDVPRDHVEEAWRTSLGAGRGKVVIAAGTGPGAAPEGWQGQHSLFTGFLLRALELDSAVSDTNQDHVITADEVITYLDKQLSGDRQGSKPFHFAWASVPAQIEIRGRGTIEPTLTEDQKQFVAGLVPNLFAGNIIPILGDGVYAAGPLSFRCLAGALAAKADLPGDKWEDIGIATAAESLQLKLRYRSVFMDELRRILAEQAASCRQEPAVHDLILDLPRPWFIVTVCYDDLLERRLEKARCPHVTVAHVLRTTEGVGAEDEAKQRTNDAGRILTVRSPGQIAALSTSDPVAIGPDECVVYRLLGAPWLNELPFAKERGLDTVVITETDLIDFLSLLRGDGTGVPRMFTSRFFRTRTLLFLEYNLDIWHYRLIGHVFRMSRETGHAADGYIALKENPYVVRASKSTMEERFWRRFKPEQVSLDLTTLVGAIRSARSTGQ